MMNEYIFKDTDYDNDPDWVVKDYFNSMNLQGKFMWMLPYLMNKIGCGVNETYCSFPDFEGSDPECHFNGIMFGVWNADIIVPECVGFKYTRQACDKYVELHPEDAEKINALLANLPS